MCRGLRADGVPVVLIKPGNNATNMNVNNGEDPPDIISDAIVTALTAERPPSRMYVGRVTGYPMWLLCRLFAHVPDWVVDALL